MSAGMPISGRTGRMPTAATKKRHAEVEARFAAMGITLVPGRAGKFNNKWAVYRGERYQSAGEAACAAHWDTLLKLRQIKDWTRPKAVVLIDALTVRNRVTMKPDFLVTPLIGPGIFYDYKGSTHTETAVFKLKVKLWKMYVPDELRVIYPDWTEKVLAPGRA